jgi:hypothetical protein
MDAPLEMRLAPHDGALSMSVRVECGHVFLDDYMELPSLESLVGASPALVTELERVAAAVMPCRWDAFPTFGVEACIPARAKVSSTMASLVIASPFGRCPRVELRPAVDVTGIVTCKHAGDAACAALCDTVRPLPQATVTPARAEKPFVELAYSGGMEGGLHSRIAIWSDGVVELTRRCGNTARPRALTTVHTMLSPSAVARLQAAIEDVGPLQLSEDQRVMDAIMTSLIVRLPRVSYSIGTVYWEPSSELATVVDRIHDIAGSTYCR